MFTRRCFVLAAGFSLALLRAQDSRPAIQVTGAVKQELSLSADHLTKMLRASVRTTKNGRETVYERVWLREVLKRAGVPQGSQLQGEALAGCVLAIAEDGYRIVFSLAKLDLVFIDNTILLADIANGKPLFGAQGRFRLVVPKDKPGGEIPPYAD